jgi:hypothetical protein
MKQRQRGVARMQGFPEHPLLNFAKKYHPLAPMRPQPFA